MNLERFKGLERVPYSRVGVGREEKSDTPCPHGGAWWGGMVLAKMHPIGQRVPAKVGTNACSHCLFHDSTEWGFVRCRFLLSTQNQVDRLIGNAKRGELSRNA